MTRPDEYQRAEARADRDRARVDAANVVQATDGAVLWPATEVWDITDFRAILDLEAAGLPLPLKDAAAMTHFKVKLPRYYQRLQQVLDMEEALAYNPILVHRLRRIRDERLKARTSRTFIPLGKESH